MKVYQVLGHVSVTVIQFLITPANVAARKIDCHSARLSGFICLQDRKLLLAAKRHDKQQTLHYVLWILWRHVATARP